MPPEREPPERDELLDRELELRELVEREEPDELPVVAFFARVAAPFFAAVLRLAASRLRVPAAFLAAAERDAF